MAMKLPVQPFTPEIAFTLLYAGLLPLGMRLSRGDIGTGIIETYLLEKMKLSVFYDAPLPYLQICTMRDNPVMELSFEEDDIRIKRFERTKSAIWQVPQDKSALDAEVLMIQISATINQYINDNYNTLAPDIPSLRGK